MVEAVSFVIPCYHEPVEVIRETVTSLLSAVDGLLTVEIIVVNDGNNAETFPVFTEQNILTLHHEHNEGYGASLMTGIDEAQYDWIGIVDADGTYPVTHFRRCIEFIDRYDMVVGSRRIKDMPLLRRLPKYFLLKLAGYMADQNIPDLNSGMRIFRKKIVMSYRRLFPKRFSFTTTITMICLTNFYKVRFLDIPYYSRVGPSAINPLADTVKFFSLVLRLALYFKPMRFFIPLSGIAFFTGICRAIRDIIIVDHFGGLTLVLFFMAFQIFFFGLLAEIINKK
ncbi:MAG: glycosyltransferase family 2 protein [Chitinispirillaceae bacterium]|nr:glycosyltransferase family 2 protein [Chitinispirillaceae bacterium]